MRNLFVGLTAIAMLIGCNGPISRSTLGGMGGGAGLSGGGAPQLTGAELAKLPALALQAAQAQQGVMPPIVGSVDLAPMRAVQASVGDVINFATVTLYDPGLARSVAATVTNSNGGFSLALGSWVPDSNVPYVVEATKGLGNYLPGWAIPRFRTLVRFGSVSKAWESVSVPTVVIGAQTTAVAIEAGLYADKVKPELVFGTVDVSVRPAGFLPKPVFFPGPANQPPHPDYSGHGIAELVKLSADIMTFLANDIDPIMSVPEVVPIVTGLTPDHGKAKDLVKIAGRGFSPLMTGNKVTFNGVAANILLAKPTEITVEVPAGATTGGLVVEGRGSTAPKTFTIDPSAAAFGIDFVYPNAGTPGTTVTILGFGFSKIPGDNTVKFDTSATPCVTSDTNFCTAVIPAGAIKGPVTVDVKNVGTSSSLPFTVLIQPVVNKMFPTTGAADHEITLDGDNFGLVPGVVKISGVVATILTWTNTQIVFGVPFQTVSGALTLTKGTLPALTVGNFTVLSGQITGWAVFNNSSANNSHNGGWHGRWRNYWYLGGGYTNGTAAQGSGYFKGPMERAEIKGDGTLGPLVVLPGVETPHSYWHMEAGYNMANSANVIGDFAYAYPSHTNAGVDCSQTAVYRANFFPDGSMTNFTPVYTVAQHPGHWHGSIRIKDYVYLLGGTGCGHDSKIQAAKINANGTLERFQIVPPDLPIASYNNGYAHVGKYLYAFGGPARREVHSIETNPDGTLKGAWKFLNNLPHRIAHGNVAVIGSYVYVLGGHSWEEGWSTVVMRSAINPDDGSLGGWEYGPRQVTTGSHDGGILVVGSKIYHSGVCCHQPHIAIGTIQ